jgi:hypothetical protein
MDCSINVEQRYWGDLKTGDILIELDATPLEADLQHTVQATLMGVINAYADAQSSLRNLRSSEDLL